MNITLPLWGFILVVIAAGGFAHILLSLLISARNSEQIEYEIAYKQAHEENEALRERLDSLEQMSQSA